MDAYYLSDYLYKWRRCDQTHPRRSDTDLKYVCHSDPLLMQSDVSYRVFPTGAIVVLK